MIRSIPICLLLLSLIVPGVPCSAQSAETAELPRYRVEDLLKRDGFQAPVPAPDGSRAVCVRDWVDRETLEQRYSLWSVARDAAEGQPLETGEPDARSPLSSPDGKWIVFLSTRERPAGWVPTPATPPSSEPALDIWLMPSHGGQAIPLAGPDKPYGRVFADSFYGNLAFSPDGSRLVFVADDGDDPRSPQEIAADTIVMRSDQGEGYTGLGPAQIWVATLSETPTAFAAADIQRVTQDDYWYGDPQWSNDGQRLVVHANRTEDQESVRYSINKNYDLWELTLAGTPAADEPSDPPAPRQLTFGPGPEVSPRVSPDGKRIACITSPRQGPHIDVFNLAVIDWSDEPRAQVVFDHRAEEVNHDETPSPKFPLPRNCWMDNTQLVYSADSGVRARTMVADAEQGSIRPLDEDDAYLEAVHAAKPFRLNSLNPLPKRLSAECRVVQWRSFDGRMIDGVLITPHPQIAKPPYKVIVNPHGGPHYRASFGVGFNDQVFAAHGYAIFKPNFRGSTGYSLEFLDADRGDFGGGDMRDILTGINALIEDGLVDASQQYLYGVSYGGYMTTWLVGQTRQFRAAVAQNAVTDLAMMWSLSDLQSWTEWEFGGRPWEVPEAMRRHSPITHVGKVTTPTLILHSRDDRRCPLPMGRAYYRSLHSQGVPTQLVIYPDEGHGIRQPKHQADVLRRTLEWFQQHGSSENAERSAGVSEAK